MRLYQLVVSAAGLVACSPDLASPASGGGPETTITSVARTPAGVQVTVRITNPDTGAVAYGPFCPGRLERLRDRAWVPVDTNSFVCRASARTIDPGGTLVLSMVEPGVPSGAQIRYVFSWIWFNGYPPVGREAASAPVTAN